MLDGDRSRAAGICNATSRQSRATCHSFRSMTRQQRDDCVIGMERGNCADAGHVAQRPRFAAQRLSVVAREQQRGGAGESAEQEELLLVLDPGGAGRSPSG